MGWKVRSLQRARIYRLAGRFLEACGGRPRRWAAPRLFWCRPVFIGTWIASDECGHHEGNRQDKQKHDADCEIGGHGDDPQQERPKPLAAISDVVQAPY